MTWGFLPKSFETDRESCRALSFQVCHMFGPELCPISAYGKVVDTFITSLLILRLFRMDRKLEVSSVSVIN